MYKNKDENKYSDYFIEFFTNALSSMNILVITNELIIALRKNLDIQHQNDCEYIDSIFKSTDLIEDVVELFCNININDFPEIILFESKNEIFEKIQIQTSTFYLKELPELLVNAENSNKNTSEIELEAIKKFYHHTLFTIFENTEYSKFEITNIIKQSIIYYLNNGLLNKYENTLKILGDKITKKYNSNIYNNFTKENSNDLKDLDYSELDSKFEIISFEERELNYQELQTTVKELLEDVKSNFQEIKENLAIIKNNLLGDVLYKILESTEIKPILESPKGKEYFINQLNKICVQHNRTKKFVNDFNSHFKEQLNNLLKSDKPCIKEILFLLKNDETEINNLKEYFYDVIKELFVLESYIRNEFYISMEEYKSEYPIYNFILPNKESIRQNDIDFLITIIKYEKIFDNFNQKLFDFIAYCVCIINIQEINILNGIKSEILLYTQKRILYYIGYYKSAIKQNHNLSLNKLIFLYIQFKRLDLLFVTAEENRITSEAVTIDDIRNYNSILNNALENTLAILEDFSFKNYELDVINCIKVSQIEVKKDVINKFKDFNTKMYNFIEDNDSNLKRIAKAISLNEHYLSFFNVISYHNDDGAILKLTNIFLETFVIESIASFINKENKKQLKKMYSELTLNSKKHIYLYILFSENIDSRFKYFHIIYISLKLLIPLNYSYNFANAIARLSNQKKSSEKIIKKESYSKYYDVIYQIFFKNSKINNKTEEINDKKIKLF